MTRLFYGVGVAGCAALGGAAITLGMQTGKGLAAAIVVGAVCGVIAAATAAIFVEED